MLRLMKKSGILMLVVFLLVGSPGVTAKTVIRLGHVGDTSDARHVAAQLFKDELEKLSNGEYEVVIYPSGQLGSYEEMQEGLQMLTNHIVIESIGTLSRFHPVAGIESMPYLFKDADHYLRVWNSPVGQDIIDLIANESNFLMIGFLYRGHRQLTSNRAVNSVADLEGLKIRVSPMRERLVTWEILGASPTPMAFGEVFSALQTGVIDAQENPLDTIYHSSLHEVQKYLVLTDHMSMGFTFQFNAKWFNSLPEKDQLAFRESIKVAQDWFNEHIRADEERLLKAMREEGITVIRPDLTEFRARAAAVADEFPELKPWYEAILNIQ
ncbi:MAG: TRAP transporter substrate-binding protein [Limnochordia bacterium]|jgi:tripartite ATP-independent transporter DctP family solute receptor